MRLFKLNTKPMSIESRIRLMVYLTLAVALWVAGIETLYSIYNGISLPSILESAVVLFAVGGSNIQMLYFCKRKMAGRGFALAVILLAVAACSLLYLPKGSHGEGNSLSWCLVLSFGANYGCYNTYSNAQKQKVGS